MVQCQGILGGERNRYAIGWTDSMPHGSDENVSGKREGGVEPRKYQIQAGRKKMGGLTSHGIPISQARTGRGKFPFSLFS